MTSLKNGQNGQTCVWIIIIVIVIVVLIVIIVSSITLYISLSAFGGTNSQLVGLLLPCRVNINVAALFFSLRAMLGGQLLLTRLRGSLPTPFTHIR